MSTFREVFCEVHRAKQAEEHPDDAKLLTKVCATDEKNHPIVWHMMEQHVRRKYRRKEGVELGPDIDWAKYRDWLEGHWLVILQGIAAILTIIVLI